MADRELQTNDHYNNFDLLRLMSAIFVIITHSFILLGRSINEDPLMRITDNTIPISMIGLYTFFTISGYLISKSMIYSKTYWGYLAKRCLRIFPALLVVLIITTFIIGAITTNISISEYFRNSETYRYLSNISLININYGLPGVFASNPNQTVNGPLYTLVYEFLFYIGIMILFFMKIMQKRVIIILFLMIFLIFKILLINNLLPPSVIYFIPHVDITFNYIIDFGIFFIIGILFNLIKERRIYKDHYLIFSIILLFCGYFIIPKPYNYFSTVLFLPYIIFNLSYNKHLQKISTIINKGDYSYGVYLWGMPIQQLVILIFSPHLNPIIYNLLVIAIVLPIAMLSWHFVEKRALALKRYL